MDGLSAKVFRTYNASRTLQEELHKKEKAPGWSRMTANEKVAEYNAANREVAILCNHQKTVSKAQETQLEAIQGKIKTLRKQKKQLKGILKLHNSGEVDKIPMKKSEKAKAEEVLKAVEKAKKMKNKASTNEEKIKATAADEKAKQMKRDLTELKFKQAHLWEKPPSRDQVCKRITAWSAKIAKMEMDLKHKDDNKDVALGTSKVRHAFLVDDVNFLGRYSCLSACYNSAYRSITWILESPLLGVSATRCQLRRYFPRHFVTNSTGPPLFLLTGNLML